MSHWETPGASDEWYTPKYIFEALQCRFNTDVAAAKQKSHVPADTFIWSNALDLDWQSMGFIWMNPPFGARNGIKPWLDKFFARGYGIALTPDRTSAPWWQEAAAKADAVLFIAGKVKFERPDGSVGKSPSTGTTLFAASNYAKAKLRGAQFRGLGLTFERGHA